MVATNMLAFLVLSGAAFAMSQNVPIPGPDDPLSWKIAVGLALDSAGVYVLLWLAQQLKKELKGSPFLPLIGLVLGAALPQIAAAAMRFFGVEIDLSPILTVFGAGAGLTATGGHQLVHQFTKK